MVGADADDGLALTPALAHERTVAFMCAETLWWRCHRRLLADRLTADGWTVSGLRIVHVEIGTLPRRTPASFGDPMPSAVTTFENGQCKELRDEVVEVSGLLALGADGPLAEAPARPRQIRSRRYG